MAQEEDLRIKDLPNTKFKGFMMLDDDDGSGKMDVDTILNNFAGKFVDNVTEAKANKLYMHNGTLYKAEEDYTGVWDDSKFDAEPVSSLLLKKLDSSVFEKFANETLFSIDNLNREVSTGSAVSVKLATLENVGLTYNQPYKLQNWNGRVLKFFKVKQGKKFHLTATSDSYLRLGYTSEYPQNGSDVSNWETAESYDVVLTAPVDGYFVISNIIYGDTTFSVEVTEDANGIGKDVDDLKTSVDSINSEIFYDKLIEKSVSNRYDDYYIASNGNATALGSQDIYDIVAIPVSAGETYIVKGVGQAGADKKCYAVYSSSSLADMVTANALKISYEYLNYNSGSYELEVTIPEGGVCLAATATYGTGVTFYKKVTASKTENVLNLEQTCFRYSFLNANILDVVTHSGTKDFVLRLGKQTIGNNLFDVIGLYQLPFNAPIDGALFSNNSQNNSDWIGPFQVAAVANKDGDDTGSGSGYDEDGFKITFTGGAHRYNNTTSGSTATARLSDLKFKINGKTMTEGYGYASKVEISWTNHIQAYNTKKLDGTGREVLKEHCKLTYNGLDWKVEIVLEPLEQISIRTWYGLQMTGVPGNTSSHWRYVDGSNRGVDETYSGNNSAKAVVAYGGNYEVEMWVDTDTDLGKRRLCYDDITNSAFHSGTKVYFMLANDYSAGKNLTLGNYYYLFGKYKFSIPSV